MWPHLSSVPSSKQPWEVDVIIHYFMVEKVNRPWLQAWTHKNQSLILIPDPILKTTCFSTHGNVLKTKFPILGKGWCPDKVSRGFHFVLLSIFLSSKKQKDVLPIKGQLWNSDPFPGCRSLGSRKARRSSASKAVRKVGRVFGGVLRIEGFLFYYYHNILRMEIWGQFFISICNWQIYHLSWILY